MAEINQAHMASISEFVRYGAPIRLMSCDRTMVLSARQIEGPPILIRHPEGGGIDGHQVIFLEPAYPLSGDHRIRPNDKVYLRHRQMPLNVDRYLKGQTLSRYCTWGHNQKTSNKGVFLIKFTSESGFLTPQTPFTLISFQWPDLLIGVASSDEGSGNVKVFALGNNSKPWFTIIPFHAVPITLSSGSSASSSVASGGRLSGKSDGLVNPADSRDMSRATSATSPLDFRSSTTSSVPLGRESTRESVRMGSTYGSYMSTNAAPSAGLRPSVVTAQTTYPEIHGRPSTRYASLAHAPGTDSLYNPVLSSMAYTGATGGLGAPVVARTDSLGQTTPNFMTSTPYSRPMGTYGEVSRSSITGGESGGAQSNGYHLTPAQDYAAHGHQDAGQPSYRGSVRMSPPKLERDNQPYSRMSMPNVSVNNDFFAIGSREEASRAGAQANQSSTQLRPPLSQLLGQNGRGISQELDIVEVDSPGDLDVDIDEARYTAGVDSDYLIQERDIEEDFACPTCRMKFKSYDQLRAHVTTMHTSYINLSGQLVSIRAPSMEL